MNIQRICVPAGLRERLLNEMEIQTEKFTRKDYRALPEGFPAQLIRGQPVKEPAPPPWHQVLVLRLADMLRRLAGLERVLLSPIDLLVDEAMR